jgi:subtilase-type serine protease
MLLYVNFYRLIVVVISLSLFGCGGKSGGTAAAVVASTPSFLDSGTSLTYNSTNASTLAATTEFQNFNYNSTSSQNPLEVINAHKAYGYGLTGAGKIIAIMDTGLSTTHSEFSAKTISTFGTLDYADGTSANKDHGLFVASIAAGENDDTDGSTMQGVAPSANLHLSSYNKINGNSYFPTHWANATDNASTAVVQNNSWGINYQVDTLQSDISSNGWTNDYGVAQKWNSSGYTANAASATAYITALNNFQDHGVIVYALSNTSSYSDADFQAALPELFSQLNEAWITAVNVEITGSLGSETYTRKSAPCGSTGAYCLGGDGFQVSGAKGAQNGTSSYWETNYSGTSFVAPQISGAVALLAEAFPTHTPAQLTDRLLASADNTFFNHDAVVTFGNGVKHGYDDEFGHGILDIYAALNPITSSSDNRSMSLYTGNSLNDNSSFQLGNSRILTSSSFGDSLQRGLISEVGYTYDDLDAGFKYNLNSHVNLSTKSAPSVNLSKELNHLSEPVNNSLQSKSSINLNEGISIGLISLPVQKFFESNNFSSTNLENFDTPYLDSNDGGVSIGSAFNLSNARLLVSATLPIELSNGQKLGSKKSLISSLEFGESQSQSVILMAGLSQENDNLLGSIGANAFSLNGATSSSTFSAIKAQKNFFNNLSLTGIATLANTNMTSPSNSMVDSASDVKSSSIALVADMRNISNDDQLSLFINQPNRVDDGIVAIKTSSLADSNRTIQQTVKSIDLDSSSRQFNYGVSYRKDLNENLAFSLKHIITTNLNHNRDSNRLHSSYIGMGYKDLKLGIATSPDGSSIESELSYVITL